MWRLSLRTVFISLALFFCIENVESRKKSNNNIDRVWKQKRTQCEKNDCAHLMPDENLNCINICTSSLCYKEVYADEPLEDGEIDDKRQKLYNSCLRRETKNAKRASQT